MEPGDEYLILATGRVTSPRDSVRLADELYGVFAADSSLTHMTREIDIFPTKRWGDYSVRFEWTSDGRLDVVGSGESYGDQGVRRIYNWSPVAGSKALVREVPAMRDTSAEGGD